MTGLFLYVALVLRTAFVQKELLVLKELIS